MGSGTHRPYLSVRDSHRCLGQPRVCLGAVHKVAPPSSSPDVKQSECSIRQGDHLARTWPGPTHTYTHAHTHEQACQGVRGEVYPLPNICTADAKGRQPSPRAPGDCGTTLAQPHPGTCRAPRWSWTPRACTGSCVSRSVLVGGGSATKSGTLGTDPGAEEVEEAHKH